MKKVQSAPQQVDAIAISQIVFDRSDWVTIWGYLIKDGTRLKMDFLLTFDMLNKLLRLSGDTGDKVQMLIVEKLERDLEEPTVLDLEELFGKAPYFDGCRIEVSNTGIQDEKGRWTTDSHCLSIDDVSPKWEVRVPALTSGYLCKQNLSKCTELLCGLYELYMGYKELGFDEESSIENAGLGDDLKFKMAYYAWEMKKMTPDF